MNNNKNNNLNETVLVSVLTYRISIIHSATLKHGYINFSLDILEYCVIDVLITREEYYLDLVKPEYNYFLGKTTYETRKNF